MTLKCKLSGPAEQYLKREGRWPTSFNKGLFTWRWGTPGRWGNPRRWGNPPFHIISHFNFVHVYMIGGVTRHMLPHLSGVPHLHVNSPLKWGWGWGPGWNLNLPKFRFRLQLPSANLFASRQGKFLCSPFVAMKYCGITEPFSVIVERSNVFNL